MTRFRRPRLAGLYHWPSGRTYHADDLRVVWNWRRLRWLVEVKRDA